jgi:hypothetical protein
VATNLLVALRTLPAGTDALVLHPVGELTVSQRLLPLDLTIDRLGSQRPSDATHFTVAVVDGLVDAGDVEEPFAIAQFQDFTDAEKLSRPPFQDEVSGLRLTAGTGTGAAATGRAVERHVRYETVTLDVDRTPVVVRLFGLVGRLFTHFLGGAAVTRSSLSRHVTGELRPFTGTETVVVTSGGYVVASTVDNTNMAGTAVFASEARAREYLAGDPGLAGRSHVIPAVEAVVR